MVPKKTTTGTGEPQKRYFILGMPTTQPLDDLQAFIIQTDSSGNPLAVPYSGPDLDKILEKLLYKNNRQQWRDRKRPIKDTFYLPHKKE